MGNVIKYKNKARFAMPPFPPPQKSVLMHNFFLRLRIMTMAFRVKHSNKNIPYPQHKLLYFVNNNASVYIVAVAMPDPYRSKNLHYVTQHLTRKRFKKLGHDCCSFISLTLTFR